MNQECIFQPVSSSASTAFVPVSALQNGIPPGTQLFGVYGQPLSGPSNAQPGGGPYSTGPPGYDQPLPSPTRSFNSYLEERGDTGIRRLRPPEEEHGMRLPPQTTFPDDNSRRRSPSSSSSPNNLAPYAPLAVQGTQPSGYDSRTQPPRGSSSGPPGSAVRPSVLRWSLLETEPTTPATAPAPAPATAPKTVAPSATQLQPQSQQPLSFPGIPNLFDDEESLGSGPFSSPPPTPGDAQELLHKVNELLKNIKAVQSELTHHNESKSIPALVQQSSPTHACHISPDS
ncbi:hypothetical protein PG989_001145 [Apiospora arundinis]